MQRLRAMYSVRAASAREERSHLVSLWKTNLHVRGDLEDKLHWFYEQGPHGAGEAFLLSADRSVVGCAGVGVRTLYHGATRLRVALFADLAIDRRHRSGGPALALLRAIQTDVRQRFDLGYGLPNQLAVAAYRRAGYRELGPMNRYVRVLRSRRYLEPSLGPVLTYPAALVVDLALRGLARARTVRARALELQWPDSFDGRFDRLWEASRRAGVLACERTSAFLTWRFAREPHTIAALVARDTGALVAYAVLRAGEPGLLEIADLLGADDRALDALLARLVPAAADRGFDAIACRFLGRPRVIELLLAHGFSRRADSRTVVVVDGRAAAPHLREPERWYLTDLDEDS